MTAKRTEGTTAVNVKSGGARLQAQPTLLNRSEAPTKTNWIDVFVRSDSPSKYSSELVAGSTPAEEAP